MYLVETPEEKADDFVKALEQGKVAADLPAEKKTELMDFIEFPDQYGLEKTRRVINQSEKVDNAYQVKVRFQAYEYKDEASDFVEEYKGILVLKMKKVGFKEWDVLDVTVHPYK